MADIQRFVMAFVILSWCCTLALDYSQVSSSIIPHLIISKSIESGFPTCNCVLFKLVKP